ncbi:hypothetical protein LJR143_002410 [Pseudoxanthomonas sp. LjRoot143]|uniref:hypothetical protein n=1 Tax=Pseudoxanthomonas sp. LjRoot143 TaxID=3342266 RepID=UPI003ECE616E
MWKTSSKAMRKRPPRVVVAFGVFLGLVLVGYGSIMLFLRPDGTGPCGRTCGLEQALLTLFGQPLYNLVFGLVWVALGLSLMVLMIALRVRR